MYVLIIFRCMPNGLLVNEVDHEQAVRKYLVKESKIGQNSIVDNIKNNLCLNFILKSYKSSITNELSQLSSDNNILVNEHLSRFINSFEHVLEKTCSTLTNFKRIFNINSHLSPSVTAIMKSLLKPVDEDENVSLYNSKLNGNSSKNKKINTVNLSPKKANTFTPRTLRSEKKQKIDADDLSSIISLTPSVQPKLKDTKKELTVVLNRLEDSVISSLISNKSSNKVSPTLVKDDIIHPLDLFDNSGDSDEEKKYTRKLRKRKPIKTNEVKHKLSIVFIYYLHIY